MSVRAAVIQLKVAADRAHNLSRARELIRQAAAEGAELMVLPEAFTGWWLVVLGVYCCDHSPPCRMGSPGTVAARVLDPSKHTP